MLQLVFAQMGMFWIVVWQFVPVDHIHYYLQASKQRLGEKGALETYQWYSKNAGKYPHHIGIHTHLDSN